MMTAPTLEDALRDIDPVELRSSLVRRVAASGFVTDDILQRAYAKLSLAHVDATSLLVDLGCGRAGASLWLAEQTFARLHGIDFDPDTVTLARAHARNFELIREPLFECASFETTWIEPGSAHAVFSLDALHLAARPLEALAEVYRLLINGGVLVFNVYVTDDDCEAFNWVQMLETAGFTTLDIDDQTRPWRELMIAKHRARIEHGRFLLRRFGSRAAAELATSRTLLGLDFGPSVINSMRRVELFARKVRMNGPRRRFAQGSEMEISTICRDRLEEDGVAVAIEDDVIDRLCE